ncbi:prepilin peptidase [Microbacterium yannicii]|uniref:prepilin peptidase n=1 Tax=Microbacterium yannicii TaxID=671622 RepID=UPI00031079AB|nr:A24 family peptidase [Microbacterium yannicii]
MRTIDEGRSTARDPGAAPRVRFDAIAVACAALLPVVGWWYLSGASASGASGGSGPDAQIWVRGVLALAYMYFAVISIVLTRIDIRTHRLPNAIVLPAYLVGGALLTIASAVSGDWSALLRAAIGMALMYGFYFALRLVRPGGMGGGDVKLAGVIGLFLAYLGWGALAVGVFAAFLLGGLFGMALILLRRADGKTAIPFGPWMLAGAWAGIFVGEAIASGYSRLLPPG